jgi:hypothetical protein
MLLDIVFFALTLLGIGFVAGYVTREIISRKRRTEYLRHKPYLPRMMKAEVKTDEGTDGPKRGSGRLFVHPPGAGASPAVCVADQERIHELLRRMQREVQDNRLRQPAR